MEVIDRRIVRENEHFILRRIIAPLKQKEMKFKNLSYEITFKRN